MKFLLLLFFTIISWTCGAALASSQELTLYFLPSPVGLDWSSPKGLVWSALKNRLKDSNRFIGHVFVEYKCQQGSELTAMTAKTFDYFQQIVFEGRGLGVLYHSFEGRLETKEELAPELKKLLDEGKVSFARFTLNEGHCERLTTYLREYRGHRVERHYGLVHRPLYGEGSGCSAFGASFLEVAGLLDQDLVEGWSNYIRVPLDLAGPPLTDQTVSIYRLLFSANSWGIEGAPHRVLTFWDPDRMDKWVKEKLTRPLPLGMRPLVIGKSKGVVLDRKLRPAPTHVIWRKD